MKNVKMIVIMVLSFSIFGCTSQSENKRLADLEAQVEQLKEEQAYQSFIIGPGVDLNLSPWENFLKAADFWAGVRVPVYECGKKCRIKKSNAVDLCIEKHPVGEERKACVIRATAGNCNAGCPVPPL